MLSLSLVTVVVSVTASSTVLHQREEHKSEQLVAMQIPKMGDLRLDYWS